LIFKGATKSIDLTNVKVNILLDNTLQHFSSVEFLFLFLLKKIIFNARTEIPEPVSDGDEVQFLIPVGYR